MKNLIPAVDLQAEFRAIERKFLSRARAIFKRGHYILGEEVARFESDFARYIGTKYAVGVASGSDAILLSLMALGVKPRDEVLTTPFTFIATATAIARLGAKPVFVDIEPNTFHLNPDLIRKKITRKTRGIVAVHLYGNPYSIDAIHSAAKRFGLFVIEDCAQACGASFRARKVGSFGECGAFSFYPTKTLAAFGDAGAITTNSRTLYEKLKSLHIHGEVSRRRPYEHVSVGINSRLDEIQAAGLNVKLKHLDRWNEARREAARKYDGLFAKFKLIECRSEPLCSPDSQGQTRRSAPAFILPTETAAAHHIYHQYTIRAPKRDQLLAYLCSNGISASIYYPIPLHLQPCFRFLGYRKGDFPEAERASREILCLPIYPTIRHPDQRLIVQSIKKFYR